MVGMSGKASEPWRGQASQQKKTAAGSVGPVGSNKTQPPAEALHVANILGDKYPADLGEKIAQVTAMLGRSEEEVCIALHDHDFDTTKAITALLDSDTQTSSQGEWTTKKKGRRSKGEGTADLIITPGDSQSSGRHGGGRGTNRAASQNVRESFGGNVSVGGEWGRGRGSKGRSSSSGRGRSSSGRREREDREGKKEERGGPRAERGARMRNRGPRAGRNRPRQAASEPERTVEEGGRMEQKTPPIPMATEAWEDMDPQPSTEWDDHHHHHHHHHHHQTVSPVGLHIPPNDLSDPSPGDQTWDSEAESKSSQPLFPEAIPFSEPSPVASSLPLTGLPTASCAQPTPLTATTPALPRQPTPGPSSHQPVEFQIGVSMPSGASHSSRHHSRHKRLARSQIPSQPVEMPKGTYPEMSELGIAFVGLELQASSATELPRDEPATTTTQEPLLTTPTTNEARFPSDPVTSAPLITTYSTQFSEDAGITTSPSYSGGGGKKLEAPPGLPHPMAASLPRTISATSNLPHSSTAPHQVAGSGSLSRSVVPSGSLPHSVVPSGSLPHSVVPSGSLPHSVVPSGLLPHSVVPSGSLPHSVGPSGSLPHSVVPSGSLPHPSSGSGSLPHSVITNAGLSHSGTTSTAMPHTMASSGSAQEPVVSNTGLSQLPKTTDTSASHSQGSGSGVVVSQLLPPEPLTLPPHSSLLSSLDLPSASDHKSTLTTATSQLLPQSFSTVSSSSVAAGSGSSELMTSQAMPTSSSMTAPTSKVPSAQLSSHHHGNHQQLQAQLQGTKHSSVQQQQAMIYPYMLQPPLVMPMSAYYDPSEMSRYQASVSMAYYQHPTSSDPAMATGMGRDHGGSGFVSEGSTGAAGGSKFGGRGADISTSTTPSNPPHSQQQGVQQGQMSHAAVFNPYYGGNVIYPMYHGYGMPGFSAHSLPKPSGGSSYPGGGVNSYQAPSGAGFGYDEMAAGAAQDYKMYGGMPGGLGKPSPLTSSTADMPSGGSYKHQGFDTGKTGSSYSTYSVPQGGYSFIPTGPVPLQMPPNYMPTHEGGGGRTQKHSKSYGGGSQLWSQTGH